MQGVNLTKKKKTLYFVCQGLCLLFAVILKEIFSVVLLHEYCTKVKICSSLEVTSIFSTRKNEFFRKTDMPNVPQEKQQPTVSRVLVSVRVGEECAGLWHMLQIAEEGSNESKTV